MPFGASAAMSKYIIIFFSLNKYIFIKYSTKNMVYSLKKIKKWAEKNVLIANFVGKDHMDKAIEKGKEINLRKVNGQYNQAD